jgi:hypothetical protein
MPVPTPRYPMLFLIFSIWCNFVVFELPMSYAEYRGHDGIAASLVTKSVSRSSTPESILRMIDESEFTQLSLLCGAFGANTFVEDTYPLHYALRKKKVGAVSVLLDAGADVDIRLNGSQPLHIAADKGLEKPIRLLLKKGADVNDQNSNNGYTPLHFGMRRGHRSVIVSLMDNGANPMICDNRGQSCLDMALVSASKELLSALLEGGLLRKVKPDALLKAALDARKFTLAMRMSVIGRKSWLPLIGICGYANPNQVRVLVERNPGTGVGTVVDSLLAQHEENALAALEAL